jgi:hypothetical protein
LGRRRQVSQYSRDFQRNWVAATGCIGLGAICSVNADCLSERIHVAEELSGRILRHDQGLRLAENLCGIPKYQGQSDDLKKVWVGRINRLEELSVANG